MITHQALEILVNVARMPHEFRNLRRQEILSDYTPYLDALSLEILNDLLGESAKSDKGIAAAKEIRKWAKRDLESKD